MKTGINKKGVQLDFLSAQTDFNGWIDGRITMPEDGQSIVKYYEIQHPESESDFVKTIIKTHDGRAIMGPICTKYQKEKEENGDQALTAFWKPLDLLHTEPWLRPSSEKPNNRT